MFYVESIKLLGQLETPLIKKTKHLGFAIETYTERAVTRHFNNRSPKKIRQYDIKIHARKRS